MSAETIHASLLRIQKSMTGTAGNANSIDVIGWLSTNTTVVGSPGSVLVDRFTMITCARFNSSRRALGWA